MIQAECQSQIQGAEHYSGYSQNLKKGSVDAFSERTESVFYKRDKAQVVVRLVTRTALAVIRVSSTGTTVVVVQILARICTYAFRMNESLSYQK